MAEDAARRSSRYIPPPDCIHERPVFGLRQQCKQPRCRVWKQRVRTILHAEETWQPGTSAALRDHARVLEVL